MEKKKPGRPKKEEVKKEEVSKEAESDIEQPVEQKVEKREEPKKKSKTGYKVKSSFFYKGIQFHVGQDIGYNEQLLKLGKIEKV